MREKKEWRGSSREEGRDDEAAVRGVIYSWLRAADRLTNSQTDGQTDRQTEEAHITSMKTIRTVDPNSLAILLSPLASACRGARGVVKLSRIDLGGTIWPGPSPWPCVGVGPRLV